MCTESCGNVCLYPQATRQCAFDHHMFATLNLSAHLAVEFFGIIEDDAQVLNFAPSLVDAKKAFGPDQVLQQFWGPESCKRTRIRGKRPPTEHGSSDDDAGDESGGGETDHWAESSDGGSGCSSKSGLSSGVPSCFAPSSSGDDGPDENRLCKFPRDIYGG